MSCFRETCRRRTGVPLPPPLSACLLRGGKAGMLCRTANSDLKTDAVRREWLTPTSPGPDPRIWDCPAAADIAGRAGGWRSWYQTLRARRRPPSGSASCRWPRRSAAAARQVGCCSVPSPQTPAVALVALASANRKRTVGRPRAAARGSTTRRKGTPLFIYDTEAITAHSRPSRGPRARGAPPNSLTAVCRAEGTAPPCDGPASSNTRPAATSIPGCPPPRRREGPPSWCRSGDGTMPPRPIPPVP